MKLVKFALSFATLAAAIAAAGSGYSVSLAEPAMVAGSGLKAGAYRVEVAGDKAMFRTGKSVVEAPVKVEEGAQKFNRTSIVYNTSGGQHTVEAIQIGGTSTRLVFGNAPGMHTATN